MQLTPHEQLRAGLEAFLSYVDNNRLSWQVLYRQALGQQPFASEIANSRERVIELTAKEFGLLEYLMRNPGHVLTRTQIIDHVWRYDMDAVSNVVDIYIHYLREKIDRGFSRQLIRTMRGVGYKIEG